MNWVDYAILALIAISIIAGLFRGLVREAVALSVWILAIWMATVYANQLEPLLSTFIKSQNIRLIVSFAAIALGILIVGSIVNMALGFLIKKSGLGFMDRLLGIFFGFGRGILIIALCLMVLNIMSFPKNEWLKESQLVPHFKPLVAWLGDNMPQIEQPIIPEQKSQPLDPNKMST